MNCPKKLQPYGQSLPERPSWTPTGTSEHPLDPAPQCHELTTITCSNFCHLSFNNHQVLSRKTKPWYVVNPNKARFKKVVRIFAFVLRFIKKLQKKSKICQSSIAQKTSYPGILNDEQSKLFLQEGTSEVKEFIKENEYQKISLQKDGILYYK